MGIFHTQTRSSPLLKVSSRACPQDSSITQIQLQPPLASLNLCCHKAAAAAKWLSAPVVLAWTTLIFLPLATEGAGCDSSQLILLGWHLPARGGVGCAGVPQSWNEQQPGQHIPGCHGYRNSPSPAGNDCATADPSAACSETILLPSSPKSKAWLVSWLNSAGLYFAWSPWAKWRNAALVKWLFLDENSPWCLPNVLSSYSDASVLINHKLLLLGAFDFSMVAWTVRPHSCSQQTAPPSHPIQWRWPLSCDNLAVMWRGCLGTATSQLIKRWGKLDHEPCTALCLVSGYF